MSVKCSSCGQFCAPVAWKMVYSGAIPMPDREIFRCGRCVDRYGQFVPQPGIVPSYSCGVFEQARKGE